MSGPYDQRLARLAYRAHNRSLGAETELPPWDDLPPRVQTAWEVAAEVIWRNALRLRPTPAEACQWCRGTGRASYLLKGGEAGH